MVEDDRNNGESSQAIDFRSVSKIFKMGAIKAHNANRVVTLYWFVSDAAVRPTEELAAKNPGSWLQRVLGAS